ncbi:polyprotein [Metarhizium brunneum]
MAGDLDIPSPTPINHPRKDDLPKRIQRHHICISQNWEYGDPRLDVDQATATQINEAIAYTMQFYDESEYQDKTLWQYFKDDFGHWTESTFQKGNTNLVRGFRDFLREKGVYCTKDGGAVAASLMRVIRETTQSAWPLDEEDIKQNHHSICDTSQDTALASTPRDLSRIPNNEDIINKRITDLNKMYTDDEKYSGKLYDFFQSKLMLFKDKCQRISMPEEGLTRALPTMLKGNAMAYYLDNLAGNDLPYVTMVTMIQRRFETDNTTQLYWDELRRTTLQTTMAKNPSKSMMEALEDLIQTIQQTYRGIRGPIVDDREMQNTLLSAVTGVPECGRAIYDGASTFEDLASKIRKSIRIAEDDKKAMTQYHSTAHFIDRQFYNNNSRHSRPKSTANRNQRSKPICYVCRKEGCWSSKHSNKEQQQAKDDWFSSRGHRTPPTDKKWQTFITFCEGDIKDNSGDDNSRRDSLSELIDESEALVTDDIEDVTATSQHFTSDLTSTAFFTKTSTPNATDILVDQIFTSSMDDAFIQAIVEGKTIDMAFITAKEEADWQLSHKFSIQLDGKVPATPMGLEELLKSEIQATKKSIEVYQQKVGSILFAAISTRPDIAFAVSRLARHNLNPSDIHHKAADRVIQNTQKSNKPVEIFIGSSDASFADNTEDRKSSQGYVLRLYGGPIAWKASKQTTVTTSSTEAELLAASEASKEMIAAGRLFKALKIKLNEPLLLEIDNKQTIRLLVEESAKLTTQLRHVDIYQHWLRQEVQNERIKVRWVESKDMVADGMTKALPKVRHIEFLRQLRIEDIRSRIGTGAKLEEARSQLQERLQNPDKEKDLELKLGAKGGKQDCRARGAQP